MTRDNVLCEMDEEKGCFVRIEDSILGGFYLTSNDHINRYWKSEEKIVGFLRDNKVRLGVPEEVIEEIWLRIQPIQISLEL